MCDYEDWLKSQIVVARAWADKEEDAEIRKQWAMQIACDETNLEMHRLLCNKSSESLGDAGERKVGQLVGSQSKGEKAKSKPVAVSIPLGDIRNASPKPEKPKDKNIWNRLARLPDEPSVVDDLLGMPRKRKPKR